MSGEKRWGLVGAASALLQASCISQEASHCILPNTPTASFHSNFQEEFPGLTDSVTVTQ